MVNGKLRTQSTGTGVQDWTRSFSPYWAKANTFTLDSLTFIELPALKRGDMAMSIKPKTDPNSFNFGKSGSLTSMIIVNKNGAFYLYAMTILADSAYMKGDYSKVKRNTYRNRDLDFTGEVFYNRMDGSLVNGWQYINGKITGAISPAAPGSQPGQVVQTVDKKHVNVFQETDCTTTITTTYWEKCDYYVDDENYDYPFNCSYYTTQNSQTTCTTITSGGGATAPPPCTPPDEGVEAAVHSFRNSNMTADVAIVINPTITGGIVDETNNVGTTHCPPVIPPDTTKKIDPCKLKKHLDSLAKNDTVAKANVLIRNKIGTQHEYAVDVNLKTFPPNGSYKIGPMVTDYNLTSVGSNFTWDSTNGYTISISHDHPQGDGPSPTDVFRLYVNSNNTQLDIAGRAALSYYESNAAMTTITTSTTYVITGADYTKLATLYHQYKADPDAFDTNFRVWTDNYSGAWDKALLKIFGDSIHLFESYNNKAPYTLFQLVNDSLVQVNCP